MKYFRFFQLLLVITVTSASVWAGIDFKRDPAFGAGLLTNDLVNAVIVQPDGKVVIGGYLYNNNNEKPLLRRLNPDGTTDPAFPVALTSFTSGDVEKIKQLPDGKYLVTGDFVLNGTFTHYARFNADWSFDSSLPLSGAYDVREVQPDGKILTCVLNDAHTFYYPRRININGTTDTSFNIFVDQTSCPQMIAQPDGKIVIAAGIPFTIGGQPAKPLYRINPDGSQDTSFDAPLATGTTATLISILPNGKIMVGANGVRRLLPDGTQEAITNNCFYDFVLPTADGNYFMAGCSRGGTLSKHAFSRVLANGTIDPTFDHLGSSVSEPDGLKGMTADGSGGYYVFGALNRINSSGSYTYGIGHIIPETTPKKARFDFDGDGKSDIAVYRPSNGYWYLNQSSAGALYIPWGGLAGDKPMAAIFDQDQKTDISVFRSGVWQQYTTVSGHCYSNMGQAGDKPMAGNLFASPDGEEAYLSRGLRDGIIKWQVRANNGCYPVNNQQPEAIAVSGELATDIPVIADFTGDSRDEIGYFRDGNWFTRDYHAASLSRSFQWGMAGDIPVPEDYDGDRETDYAVFRPSTGVWWVNLTSGGYWAIQFGLNGDIPVPADYDGDGKADIAVFRDGVWWQFHSATQSLKVDYWGTTGDAPVPAQNQ